MRHVVKRNKHLPLSEPVLLILMSLAQEPRHGYAIMKDVEELSGGQVKLSTGTLYGAIRRLLEDEWIERIEDMDATRGKQSYRLTGSGSQVLAEETSRMKTLVQVASERIGQRMAEVKA